MSAKNGKKRASVDCLCCHHYDEGGLKKVPYSEESAWLKGIRINNTISYHNHRCRNYNLWRLLTPAGLETASTGNKEEARGQREGE